MHQQEVKMMAMDREKAYVLWFDELRREDVALVGGKSSSLGELTFLFLTVLRRRLPGTATLCMKQAWMLRFRNC